MDKINLIIDKLNSSNYCVAFTGAGISTESGTSLQIYPAGSMPLYATGDIIVVNKEPTSIDEKAQIVIYDSLCNIFDKIARNLKL